MNDTREIHIKPLLDQIAELEAKVDRLTLDSVRLDWAENYEAIIQPHGKECCGWLVFLQDLTEGTGDTLREAIDVVMALTPAPCAPPPNQKT